MRYKTKSKHFRFYKLYFEWFKSIKTTEILFYYGGTQIFWVSKGLGKFTLDIFRKRIINLIYKNQ